MVKREVYNGIFIPAEAISEIRDKLAENGIEVQGYDKEIASPHVTLEYRGAESMQDYFGERAEIRVVGYASGAPTDSRFSGATEGVAVEIRFPDNPELQSRFEATEYDRNETCGREGGFQLHITMSLDGEMKAVETGYLEFHELPEDKQFVIEGGMFGGYMEDGTVDIGDNAFYKDMEVTIKDIDSVDCENSPDKDNNPDNDIVVDGEQNPDDGIKIDIDDSDSDDGGSDF